jgi:hypothetical protein
VPPAGTIGISGMDASANCSVLAAPIATTGRKFVARYYSKFPGKVLTHTEALSLSTAGLHVVTVYEDTNNDIQFFTPALGSANATLALQQAKALGQPAGSAI